MHPLPSGLGQCRPLQVMFGSAFSSRKTPPPNHHQCSQHPIHPAPSFPALQVVFGHLQCRTHLGNLPTAHSSCKDSDLSCGNFCLSLVQCPVLPLWSTPFFPSSFQKDMEGDQDFSTPTARAGLCRPLLALQPNAMALIYRSLWVRPGLVIAMNPETRRWSGLGAGSGVG